MNPMYRRPDWLGGCEVELGATVVIDGVEFISTYDANNRRALVPRGDLIPLTPPSIDDPVELPLVVRGVSHAMSDVPVRIHAPIEDAPDGSAAWLAADNHCWLTAEQCRDLARALWLLGTREPS